MNRYNFINRNNSRIVAMNVNQQTEQKTEISALAALQEGLTRAKYEFAYDEAVTRYIRENAASIEMTINSYADGSANNRIHIKWQNGTGKFGRVFGVQDENGNTTVLPPKTFSSEEIKKLRFGTCSSAGVVQTEENNNKVMPVIYVDLTPATK